MRLGAGREGGDLLVADMNPLDLPLAADRVGQAVQAVADDAVNSLDAGRGESFGELVRNCLHVPLLGEETGRRRPCRRIQKISGILSIFLDIFAGGLSCGTFRSF